MKTTLLSEQAEPTSSAMEVERHDELAQIAERVLEIPQPDTPRLDIHRVGCQVSITWQGTGERFRLEVSDHAYVHGNWRPVEEAVQIAGDIHRVKLPGATHLRYIRLARKRIPRSGRARPAVSVGRQLGKRRSSPKSTTAVPHSQVGDCLDLTALWLLITTAAAAMLQHVSATY